MTPRQTENKKYFIYQPGSSVATALTEGEALQKHMFLLEIKKIGHKMTPIPMQQTRPLLYKQLELQSLKINSQNLEDFISQTFEDLLKTCKNTQKLFPPLVRLKIEVTGFENFQVFYFNSKFNDKTANKDIITI